MMMMNIFHLTCHIDIALKQKIERGEFVDLEKLLPRTRAQVVSDEQKMQFVNREGSSYWIPADWENKISGIRRWDQAFRVYAAIYSKSNPHRSAEIWQYIHMINTAASSYTWKNVCYYDLTFRRLMHERPQRSWVKTYVQLWNLAMCDPLSKGNLSSGKSYGTNNSTPNSHTNWRDRCCWRFNRGGKCKKWNCRFDHRCDKCGLWSHGAQNCPNKGSDSIADFSKRGNQNSP